MSNRVTDYLPGKHLRRHCLMLQSQPKSIVRNWYFMWIDVDIQTQTDIQNLQRTKRINHLCRWWHSSTWCNKFVSQNQMMSEYRRKYNYFQTTQKKTQIGIETVNVNIYCCLIMCSNVVIEKKKENNLLLKYFIVFRFRIAIIASPHPIRNE